MELPIDATIQCIRRPLYIWKGQKDFVLSSKDSILVPGRLFGDRSIRGFVMNYICATGSVNSLEKEPEKVRDRSLPYCDDSPDHVGAANETYEARTLGN